MRMYEYRRRFRFVEDINGDFAFSISDVWGMVKLAWLLPSNVVAALLHETNELAAFLEIDCATGQGVGGAMFSLLVWFFVLAMLAGIVASVTSQ